MANEPYEIIVAPFTVYVGPVGEAFPAIDLDPPGGNWTKLGSSGDRNYNNEGVTVRHTQSLEVFRPAGATGPVKAWRTEEDLIIAFSLADLTLEQYKYVLNNNAVTDTAEGTGTAGHRGIPMYRGLDVSQHALLVRGDVSPYGDTWKTQYEVPVVIQEGEPAPTLTKAVALLAAQFRALIDPNAAAGAEFGTLRAQDADPV